MKTKALQYDIADWNLFVLASEMCQFKVRHPEFFESRCFLDPINRDFCVRPELVDFRDFGTNLGSGQVEGQSHLVNYFSPLIGVDLHFLDVLVEVVLEAV